MPATYALVYGFLEGPWHGQSLRAELEKRGLKPAPAKSADIVVAHSGGCYFVPESVTNVLLIDPPYWPKKSLIKSLGQNIYQNTAERTQEGNLGLLIAGQFWWMAYAVIRFPYNVRLGWRASNKPFYNSAKGKVAIIRNRNSVFCSTEIKKVRAQGRTFSFYEFGGDHNDVYVHPEAYADLIAELAK